MYGVSHYTLYQVLLDIKLLLAFIIFFTDQLLILVSRGIKYSSHSTSTLLLCAALLGSTMIKFITVFTSGFPVLFIRDTVLRFQIDLSTEFN